MANLPNKMRSKPAPWSSAARALAVSSPSGWRPRVSSKTPRSAPIASAVRIASCAAPGLLLEPERLFDGEFIVGIEDVLDARLVDRLAIGGDLHARLRVRHALDTHGDLHWSRQSSDGVGVQKGNLGRRFLQLMTDEPTMTLQIRAEAHQHVARHA